MRFNFIALGPFLIILLILFLFALMAVIAVLIRYVGGKLKVENGPYYEAVPLLSPAEQSFFCVLQQSVEPGFRLFAKVRLADIVRPVRSVSRSGWQSSFNRITGKHIDFALCDPKNLRVVAVIELDDSTHKRFERGIRDGLVDAALTDAQIPVLRVPAAHAYSVVQIRQQVESLLRPSIVTS